MEWGRLPPSMAGSRLPSSANYRPATGVLAGKRTKLRG